MSTHTAIILGSFIWLGGLLALRAGMAVRDERRQRRNEWEAARRILQAQQWRVSSMIDQRVQQARENHKRQGGDR